MSYYQKSPESSAHKEMHNIIGIIIFIAIVITIKYKLLETRA